MAGEFGELNKDQFISMVEKIYTQEKVTFTSMHESICVYLENNEPVQGFILSGLAV